MINSRSQYQTLVQTDLIKMIEDYAITTIEFYKAIYKTDDVKGNLKKLRSEEGEQFVNEHLLLIDGEIRDKNFHLQDKKIIVKAVIDHLKVSRVNRPDGLQTEWVTTANSCLNFLEEKKLSDLATTIEKAVRTKELKCAINFYRNSHNPRYYGGGENVSEMKKIRAQREQDVKKAQHELTALKKQFPDEYYALLTKEPIRHGEDYRNFDNDFIVSYEKQAKEKSAAAATSYSDGKKHLIFKPVEKDDHPLAITPSPSTQRSETLGKK